MSEWGRPPGPDTYPDPAPDLPYPAPFWDEIRLIGDHAMYYGFDAQPISMREWSATHADFARRQVNRTLIGEGITVSTVWIGLDMSFLTGPPQMFETMVFVELDEPRTYEFEGGAGFSVEQEGTEQYRWPTWEAAAAGHDRIVAELSAQMPGAEVHSAR